MCPYASCSDCCIGLSNGTRVGPNLVGGGGGCSCMLLLHPAPTCPGAVLTFALCTGGDFLQSTGADTPLVHVVVRTCCNLRWGVFHPSADADTPLVHAVVITRYVATCAGGVIPSSHWCKYSICTVCWWLHVVVPVVYMWWWWWL